MVSPTAVERGRTILAVASRSEISLLAAAIAFYALLSIVPLAVVLVAVAAALGGDAAVDAIAGSLDALLSTEMLAFVETGLEAEAGRSVATAAGLLVTGWGSLKVFRAIDRSFRAIDGGAGRATLVEAIRDAVAVVVAIVGIAGALAAAAATLGGLGLSPPGAIVQLAVAPVLAVVLWPLYLVFGRRSPSPRDAFPGAAVAAAGIALSTAGLQLYVAIAAPFAVYGVLAGTFVVMTWLYLVALALLVGAVVNATDGGRHRQLHFRSPSQAPTEGPMPDDADREGLTAEDLAAMHQRLEELESRVDERTVHRDDIERELRAYVRRRQRRGHARGWGPYLVLLYGVIMTIGAFHYLAGWVAIAAMIVIWLSTLGLYVFMLVVGAAIGLGGGLPGRLMRLRERR
ncbi:MAG: YhjD/YihY/BrkB family envelope integrity protein [Halobacteriales archaeon]